MTARRALDVAGLVLGKRVHIRGANGGVGRIAVQLARASGAHVAALVRNAAASRHRLCGLGAGDVVEEVDGRFDLAGDAVGGSTPGLAIEDVVPGGCVVNIATAEHEPVAFQARRFDRVPGASIYSFNPHRRDQGALERDERPHAPAPTRREGQVELEYSWREASGSTP
jgi:NADPH:quinone reductase